MIERSIHLESPLSHHSEHHDGYWFGPRELFIRESSGLDQSSWIPGCGRDIGRKGELFRDSRLVPEIESYSGISEEFLDKWGILEKLIIRE
jgi:hypothetical protein